jgi:hypothetical protein
MWDRHGLPGLVWSGLVWLDQDLGGSSKNPAIMLLRLGRKNTVQVRRMMNDSTEA